MTIQNQATLLFQGVAAQPGLATLSAPNHIWMLMRMGDGVLLINSSRVRATLRYFATREHMPARLKFENGGGNGSEKSSPEVASTVVSSVRREIFPDFFEPEKVTGQSLITSKQPYSNLSPGSTEYYYRLVKKYISRINPITALDIEVFQDPVDNPFHYGKPMYCHNYVIQTLGIDVGNILTTKHLRHRLLTWHGQTNFKTFVLHDRPMTDLEQKLGMVDL